MRDEPSATSGVAASSIESQFPTSRYDALKLGSKFYWTGEPCVRGHVSKRRTSGAHCLECATLDNEKNRASRLEYKKRPDQKAVRAKYWKDHPEKTREIRRRYYENNRETLRARCLNRVAKRRDASGKHSAEDIADILRLQNNRCAYCRIKLRGKYHVDHIVPLSAGGSNDRSNLQALCVPCNLSKGAKPPLLYAREIGFLL